MFTKLFTKAAVAGVMFLAAQAASAATYNILNVENLTAGGFRTSVFHEATSSGGKSGDILAEAINGTGSGTWNSDTGAISVGFNVLLADNITIVGVSGTGTVTLGATRANGLHGSIDFLFSAAIGGDTSYSVSFLDYDYGIGPNSFDPSLSKISLWGAEGTATTNGNFNTSTTTIGADLRIMLAVVPLPAGGLLLLGALGGLGAVGRRRAKKASAA